MKLDAEQQRLLAIALRRKDVLQRIHCIDPYHLDSRPSPPQQRVLDDLKSLHVWLVAGNQSGKSQVGGRVVAWKFEENHPFWERSNGEYCIVCKSRDWSWLKSVDGADTKNQECNDCGHKWIDWGSEPLLIIVSGAIMDQTEKLWSKKIEPFLEKGSYTVDRIGKVLKRVIHKTSKNEIIFTSHDKSSESRKKIQSYAAHHFWLDEMPSDHRYVEEAQRRVDAHRGQFMGTLTPKSRNSKIRVMIDTVDPAIGHKYMMGKLDNPIYKGREDEEWAKIRGLAPEEQDNIMTGAWLDGDDKVFDFLRSKHATKVPHTYKCDSWKHVLAFDPAASGNGGLVIAAQNPANNFWHVVKAVYIKGKAPSELVTEVKRISAPYNVVRKIYDTHETWFQKQAMVEKDYGWMGVEKHSRKKELITGLQQALLDHWLVFDPCQESLFSEFQRAEWAPGRDDAIRGSQHFHLLDALQYLIDLLPQDDLVLEKMTRDQSIMKAHMDTIVAKQIAKNVVNEEQISGRKKFTFKRSSRWKARPW